VHTFGNRASKIGHTSSERTDIMKSLLALIAACALLTACAEIQTGGDMAYAGACPQDSIACVAESPSE
jgi:uncharacterized lipoprotein YajG